MVEVVNHKVLPVRCGHRSLITAELVNLCIKPKIDSPVELSVMIQGKLKLCIESCGPNIVKI